MFEAFEAVTSRVKKPARDAILEPMRGMSRRSRPTRRR
jgi:hypothetical protein